MYNFPLSLLLMFWLATPAEVSVVTIPFRGSVDLALTPSGKAEIERTGTVSRVKIEVDRVQPPTTLGPAFYTYVAWAVSPEGEFENLGEVALTDARLRFEGSAHFDQMGILVTAEPHYMVDRPSSAIVYRNLPPRDAAIRRLSVTFDVGQYDYSKLPASSPTSLSQAAQARTAFEIARAAGADRLAESEFRLARVALDTMEEMLNRSAPAEIVLPTAHEAVRRSQRALMIARDSAVRNELASMRNEVDGLNRERQQLTGQLEDLKRQLAASGERVRQLESDLAAAGQENGRLVEERTQTLARMQTLDKELQDLRVKLDAAKPMSVLVPGEYIDPVKQDLTPAGRDALAKIIATSNMWTGPLRVEGASGTLEVVKKFFVASGVSADRLVFVEQK